MPAPMCISMTSFLEETSGSKDELSSADKDENERMQVKKQLYFYKEK
jgi:hypothetical protein